MRHPVTIRLPTNKMHLKDIAALLPMMLCLATAARMNSYSGSSIKPIRNYYNYEDFVFDSFGSGKHYDALKTTRSSNDFGSKQPTQSKELGKSGHNHLENDMDEAKTGYAEASGRGGEELGAPAYGSIGTGGIGSPSRSFGGAPVGHQSGGFSVAPAFGSVSATAFSKSNGGFSGHGAQSGSFGGHQGGSFGGQSAGFHGGQSGSFGNPAGSYGGGVGGQGGAAYAGGAQQGGYGSNPDAGMPYQFQYSVNEYGNNFGHSQSSDGNQVTGRYYVQLPDGRLQTVDFKSDPYSGYTANVQYEGEAQYPTSGYSSNAGGYGGGSVGQLPLAFNNQGNIGGPNSLGAGYSGQGSLNSKPY